MFTLILILLPWVSGGLNFFLAAWQFQEPLWYPWPLVAGILFHTLVIVIYAWRRQAWRVTVEKMLPSVMALAAIALSASMFEGKYVGLALSLLMGVLSWLTLKLFFLMCFDPQGYPVNSLSHVNLALVPLTVFFMAWGLDGMLVFIRLPWWVIIPAFIPVMAALYATTAHPSATAADRARWAALGAFVGLACGVLVQVLPVGMLVQGMIVALLAALPVRIRRYAYQPKPSTRVAYFEGIVWALIFVSIILFSRWA